MYKSNWSLMNFGLGKWLRHMQTHINNIGTIGVRHPIHRLHWRRRRERLSLADRQLERKVAVRQVDGVTAVSLADFKQLLVRIAIRVCNHEMDGATAKYVEQEGQKNTCPTQKWKENLSLH